VPNQVVVPLHKGTRRLFLFWTPASGYDWGHAYHCLEHVCPDPDHRDPRDIFFCAPELAVHNPIPTPMAGADQSDDHNTTIVGVSASSDVGNKRTRQSSDEESIPSMCGERWICQW